MSLGEKSILTITRSVPRPIRPSTPSSTISTDHEETPFSGVFRGVFSFFGLSCFSFAAGFSSSG